MAQSAGKRVTRAYERKYDIDGAQKELVRAHIPRIIQELAAQEAQRTQERTT
jgi:hypothetical protein